MIYSLYIHQGEPPVVREVMPGESLALHISQPTSPAHLMEMLNTAHREFDFVITMGFGFTEMGEDVQEALRQLMVSKSAVMRFD